MAISNALVVDSGWYFCTAENSGGKSVTSFYFQVYGEITNVCSLFLFIYFGRGIISQVAERTRALSGFYIEYPQNDIA